MNRKLEARHIEVVDPRMAAIYREMSTQQKGEIIASAHRTMKRLLRGRILTDHPDWTEEQINTEVAERLLYGSRRTVGTGR
ncbi:MAG: hypothetical protein WD768_06555 [Phycisphaeraceae bacterium]